MNKKGRPDSETVDLGEDRLMLAGTAARLFPVGGFSVSGTHGLRICGRPLRLFSDFRVDLGSGPALDGAEESWTGVSKQEARGGRRGCSYVGMPLDLPAGPYQISCVLQPAKSPTCARADQRECCDG